MRKKKYDKIILIRKRFANLTSETKKQCFYFIYIVNRSNFLRQKANFGREL